MQDEVTEEVEQEPSQGSAPPAEAAGDGGVSDGEVNEAVKTERDNKESAASVALPSPPSAAQVSNAGHGGNLDLILDVPLQLSVELGRTRMLIRDLVQLAQGSIVELRKEVGEPVDVMVNDKLIARGEVVVMEDKFGVRLTDIVSPSERIEKLR